MPELAMYADLPDKRYDIIYADPPWKFRRNWRCKKVDRCFPDFDIGPGYPCLSEEQLRQLPVSRLASEEGCLLFLWTTSCHVAQATRLMAHWGFEYRGVFCNWIKTTSRGKDATLPGFYCQGQSEFLLVGSRGRVKKLLRPGATRPRQVLRAARRAHSQKPSEARERIDRYFGEGARKIELFARERPDGWDAWGNQVSPA